ncbi:GNAT family N-acetyltransferase [Virgibacillus salexigens]|uniref:GNAT family N-acetyltransferase n=1 Tax=Virgibacillus TaxID=84406 RepID=UPI0013686EF0|nr:MULTISPECIES: GNAT family N-acetyltransferase [Virgibacillus]MYL43715.1 GNAT family N-acetyltransferase [Virgibacillus massiliensis]
MNLQIREVSKDNWKTIACLSVSQEQEAFIESNSFSILQSIFEEEWYSVGLYVDDKAIGYAMYGEDKDSGDIWLDRFMVDRHAQGNGYAAKLLPKLLSLIEKQYDYPAHIYLSVTSDNIHAQQFYRKFGFRFNGEQDNNGLIPGMIMVRYNQS